MGFSREHLVLFSQCHISNFSDPFISNYTELDGCDWGSWIFIGIRNVSEDEFIIGAFVSAINFTNSLGQSDCITSEVKGKNNHKQRIPDTYK